MEHSLLLNPPFEINLKHIKLKHTDIKRKTKLKIVFYKGLKGQGPLKIFSSSFPYCLIILYHLEKINFTGFFFFVIIRDQDKLVNSLSKSEEGHAPPSSTLPAPMTQRLR